MDDHVLVREIEKNNDLAFGTLIRKYQKLVYTAAYKLLQNAEDAEDICQDVFLSLYKNISQVRNRDDLSGWLFRSACNKSLSLLRRKKADRTQKDQDLSGIKHADDNNTPDLELEQKELTEELFSAISALPDLQQKVLLLHKFENLSHQEIGEMLELSKASVESLIYRAKCNLRKSLFDFFKNNYKQGL